MPSAFSPRPLPAPLQQIDRTRVRWQGRCYTYFGGCDYFRLASHPEVLAAVRAGLERFGLNVAASRATTGNHPVYEQLERALARFFNVEAAVLVSNGYMTNLAVAQAWAGNFTHVLMDERAHACLHAAARVFGAPVVKFRHRDAAACRRALGRLGRAARPILLTDGMFAHDGGLAPLSDYAALLPRGAMILLDDAHGAGTLGRWGRGTPEYLDAPRDQIVQTITLSKAFGVYGGAILGSRALREQIVSQSSVFAGNTPLPLPLAWAALKSLQILRQDRALRTRLAAHTDYVKRALRNLGQAPSDTPSPIAALVPQHARDATCLRQRCRAAGVFPSFIRYPGGPENGYFRFAWSSAHTRSQLDALLSVFAGSA